MNQSETTGDSLAPVATMPRPPLAYLIATAIVSGALIMVIEVLGSRVIGPFFGASLFVWTSLITVTLIALAGGYAIGGVLADRHPSADWLYRIILLAGLATLAVPLLKGAILKACVPLGLRAGAFVATVLLFGPALFLLGCVSPYLIRLSAREMTSLGRTVGGFYALSTAGSVAGTLLTGFVLIAYLGVDRILQIVGGILVALALGYGLFLRRRRTAVVLFVLATGLIAAQRVPQEPTSKLLPNGTRVTLLDVRETFYGTIRVVDYTYADRHTRELMIDGLIQGGIDMRSRQSVYPYSYMLQLVPMALRPGGSEALVIGLGAGLVPRAYAAHGVRTDAIEIDPEVVRVAREYFGFRDSGDMFVADARQHLAVSERRYDYVVLDAFNGDHTPAHLLSVEALAAMRARLKPGGVWIANIVASLRRDSVMSASVVHTLHRVFDNVEVIPLFDPAVGEGWGNLIVAAYDGPVRIPALRDIGAENVHRMAVHTVRASLARRFEFPPDTAAMMLTDNFNPIDFRDAWLKEAVRRAVLASSDWDILLNSR